MESVKKYSTFSGQDTLKTLPVPPLEGTLEGFITATEPLVSAQEFAELKNLAADFGITQGRELQARLEQKAALLQSTTVPPPFESTEAHPDGSNFPDNHWLERWWEVYAYLSDRTSLALNINCFQTHFGAKPSSHPVLRASWMAKGTFDAKRLLAEEIVPPEYVGTQLMCSAQYHRVFSTTRIPGKEVDRMHTFRESNHACVMRRNHWYCVENADKLSVKEWEDTFNFILADAGRRPYGPQVSVFTGEDRTKWASVRGRLLLSPKNADTINMLESAVTHFILSEATPTTPAGLQELGQTGDKGSIWFDKSGSHIFCDNGMAVSNLEHCSADAVVPARMYIYADEFVHKNAPEVGFSPDTPYKEGISGIPITGNVQYHEITNATSNILPQPRILEFVLDEESMKDLVSAKFNFQKIVDDNIVDAMDFRDFGGKDIQKRCQGISSDSFMQMALALAYYRDQKTLPVTYETASTRLFFHGRTDCIRVQSLAMKEFLQLFDQADRNDHKVASLVRDGGKFHRNFTKRCMQGAGIDRHLLGLRVLAMESGMELHPFFRTKAFQVANDFTLSTSQMPFPCLDWPGFGAYSPGAYAVCYRFTANNTIVATVASRRHSGGGKDAKRFSETIKQAMRDIMKLLSQNPPAAKL